VAAGRGDEEAQVGVRRAAAGNRRVVGLIGMQLLSVPGRASVLAGRGTSG
jgi:hypothetical protein